MPRLLAMHRAGIISIRAQKKLASAGIHTVEDLLWITSSGCASVMEKASMTEVEVKEALTSIIQHLAPLPRPANEVWQEWKRKDCIISTGCHALDDLLSGGIFTSEMTELAGAVSCGKTQICLSLSANVARDLGGTVAYLDSSHSLCPLRLQELCSRGRDEDLADEEEQGERERREVSALAALNRVRRFPVTSADSLLERLAELEHGLAGGEQRVRASFYRQLKLVVVDSIGSIFSAVMGGRSGNGQALLLAASAALQRLMQHHHLAVVVTNHTWRPEEKGLGDHSAALPLEGTARTWERHGPVQQQHALGKTWGHVPAVSLTLQRLSEGVGRAAVRKSNKSATLLSADFAVRSDGVGDVGAAL